MQRTIIELVKMRLADLEVGDVVNRDPESGEGWFRVGEVRRLPSGEVNVSSANSRSTIMGDDFDIVAVQLPRVVEVHSLLVPATN